MSAQFEPLSEAELAAIRKLDTPTISNVLEPLNIRPWTEGFTSPEIRCLFPNLGTMAGYAVTLEISARTQSAGIAREHYWQAVLDVPAPRVIVIHDQDYPNPIGSFWGEVQSNIGLGLKAVGCITDGGVRDLAEAEGLGFHFFAKDVLVSHAYAHVEKIGGTVVVGGLEVSPGDLLIADRHGVIQVPHDLARQLPELAKRLAARELIIIEAARKSGVSVESLKEASAQMQAIARGDVH